MLNIELKIAQEIAAAPAQVKAAVELLDGGATVPFIARYRKEVTGGLDDTQLRTLAERLHYLRELEDRRDAVLASIDEQGKLSDELKQQILDAETKARLEDLYLPYKPKRRTRAQIAREAGLQPLADALRGNTPPHPRYSRSPTSTRKKISPTSRRRSTAPARSSWKNFPKTRRWSANCANGCGSAVRSARK